MNQQEKYNSTWKDSLLTLIASACVIVLNILLTAILSRQFQKTEFESYLFIRRFITFIFPLTTLSIGTGLSRLLAQKNTDPEKRKLACQGSLTIILVFNLFILLVAFLIPKSIITGYLFPLPADAVEFWRIMFIWLGGYSGFILIYSFYRGRIQMNKANLTNLALNGIVPLLVVFLLISTDNLTVSGFLLYWAIGYAVGFPLFLIYSGNLFSKITESLAYTRKHILEYCVPRIPAGVLLAAPGYFIPFLMIKDKQNAVFLLSGMLVIQSVFYLTDPLGQVFLPRSALWNETDDQQKISDLLSKTTSFFVLIGLTLTVQTFIWSDLLTLRWFGDGFEESAKTVCYLAPAIIPASFFAPLRSVLDGIEKKPLITYFLTFSVICSLIISFIYYFFGTLSLFNACVALNAYHFLTFICLLIALKKRIKIEFKWQDFFESLILALILGVCGFLFHKMPWENSVFYSVVSLGVTGCICVVVLFAWCYYRRPFWFKLRR